MTTWFGPALGVSHCFTSHLPFTEGTTAAFIRGAPEEFQICSVWMLPGAWGLRTCVPVQLISFAGVCDWFWHVRIVNGNPNYRGAAEVKPARPETNWVRYGSLAALLLVILFFSFVRVRLRNLPLERDEGEFA